MHRPFAVLAPASMHVSAQMPQPQVRRVFDALIAVMQQKHETVLRMLKRLDHNNNGSLPATELQHGLGNLGIKLKDEEVTRLVWVFDSDGNKQVKVMAYTVMAYTVMACIVMACTVMAHIVMGSSGSSARMATRRSTITNVENKAHPPPPPTTKKRKGKDE